MVALACTLNLHLWPSPHNDLDTIMENFEIVWIEVDNKNGTTFLFCCVYIHPSTDVTEFSECFQTLLPKLTSKQVFIMGDFSISFHSFSYESHPN